MSNLRFFRFRGLRLRGCKPDAKRNRVYGSGLYCQVRVYRVQCSGFETVQGRCCFELLEGQGFHKGCVGGNIAACRVFEHSGLLSLGFLEFGGPAQGLQQVWKFVN